MYINLIHVFYKQLDLIAPKLRYIINSFMGSNHTTPFLLNLISGQTSCPDNIAPHNKLLFETSYKKDEFGVNIFSIGSVFVRTWRSH